MKKLHEVWKTKLQNTIPFVILSRCHMHKKGCETILQIINPQYLPLGNEFNFEEMEYFQFLVLYSLIYVMTFKCILFY